MFFDSWSDLAKVLVVGTLAYIWLVFFQRVSGKRTLSKMNAFDFIVTVALGSALANVLLSETVSLSEGVLGLTLLMSLQLAVTWLSVRSKAVVHFVKAEPTLIFYDGEFLRNNMQEERVIEEEVLQAIRSSGVLSLDDVQAVVLETSGELSVVKRGKADARTSLSNLKIP